MRTQYLLLLTWCIGYANANAQTIRIPADYPTIQAGIDHAAAGDTVLVSPGVYSENLNFNGLDIVLASFYLTSGSTDFIAQTIIDGGNHTAVITLDQGESSYAEITGFTLVNGTHDESIQWPEFGGGIVCLGASPFIHHNRILNCRGRVLNYSDFGGIYCRDSGARIFENEIDSIECFFVKKLGGIVSHRSALIIHKNAIRNISGGYVFQGGGVSADSSELDLFRNVIAEGHFDLAPYTASVRLFNSSLTAINNTLAGELALDTASIAGLTNNIILGPSVASGIYVFNNAEATIDARYNTIAGGWPGAGNFDADPMFADPEHFDFHLNESSPCIDAGDPFFSVDPDGTRADIGAFSVEQTPNGIQDPNPFPDQLLYPNPAKDYVKILRQYAFLTLDRYVVFSLDGKLVDQGPIAADGNLYVGKFPAGIYGIRLYSVDGKVHTCKLIKTGY